MGFAAAQPILLRAKLIQTSHNRNAKLHRRVELRFSVGDPMEQQFKEWKRSVDRFWSAAAPDYLDAAKLTAEIAHGSDDVALRQAAAQALPSLHSEPRQNC
jgi:hypothetical protein